MRIVFWKKNRGFTAFDALMDDGKASIRQKKIMDVFDDDAELFLMKSSNGLAIRYFEAPDESFMSNV